MIDLSKLAAAAEAAKAYQADAIKAHSFGCFDEEGVFYELGNVCARIYERDENSDGSYADDALLNHIIAASPDAVLELIAIASSAAPQVGADELAVLNEIADLFSIGAEARKEPGIILANVRNTVKFANLLHAVEREFFMSPDDENECLVNCWGSTEEQYLDSMRSALQAAPVQAQEPTNENEWLVANLMKALRPLRDFAYDRGNPYQTGIAPLDWEAFAEAANRMVRDYKPGAPVQPVAVPEAAQQNGGLVRAALIDLLSPEVERAANSGAVSFECQSNITTIFARGRQALAQSAFDAAPAAQGDAEDTERLRWLAETGARISWSMDGEYCAVWLPDERDGTESRPAEGYPLKCYDSWHRAIDAAIAAKAAS